MAIYKKLAQIQSEIRGLTKDKGAYGYDYLTGDKLLSEIRPRMIALNLLLLPQVVEVRTEPVTYAAFDNKVKALVNKTEILATVQMSMTWVDTEDNETLTQMWAGTGMNQFDKGFGSALTYGERYYLLKLFHIPTDKDDVDALAAQRDEALEKGAQTLAQKAEVGNLIDDLDLEPTNESAEKVALEKAINEAMNAADQDAMKKICDKYRKTFGRNQDFVAAVNKRLLALKKK